MHEMMEGQEHGAKGQAINIGTTDRWISILGGATLTYIGLRREGALGRALLSVSGGYLLYRGVSGHDPLYRNIGITTTGRAAERSITIEKTIVVDRAPEEVYNYWHNFENLPRFMTHLERVEVLDGNRFHWIVGIPGGIRLEWTSEMTNDFRNEYIEWRSLPTSDFRNDGSVRFKNGPKGGDTEIRFRFAYYPPVGAVGIALSGLVKAIFSRTIAQDLERFKHIIETEEMIPAHA